MKRALGSVRSAALCAVLVMSCTDGADPQVSSVSQLVPINSIWPIHTTSFDATLYRYGAVYQKPLVIIEGYDPLDDFKPETYMQPYWSPIQNRCMPALLDPGSIAQIPAAAPCPATSPGGVPARAAANGYSVWIVSVKTPAAQSAAWDIAALYNSELHSTILNWTGVRTPYVLAGYSMGALVARKALATMQTRVSDILAYISFDGPHQGAYVPESLQMYMLDTSGCAGNTLVAGDPYNCRQRFVTYGLSTAAASSLIKNRIYPTCFAGGGWPSFWSDCFDAGGCHLPGDGEWSHCDQTHGDFALEQRAPSWYMTNYGWFSDIPRYALSNSSIALSPATLESGTKEIVWTDITTVGDHHLATDGTQFPQQRGSLDPYVDQMNGQQSTRTVLFLSMTGTLHKVSNFNFISYNSAFGIDEGLTWTGRLTGQNVPSGNCPTGQPPTTCASHMNVSNDSVDYIAHVIDATYAFTTYPGDHGPASACGNGVCGESETYSNCPADCAPPPPVVFCGDGSCNGSETCTSCETDCGICQQPCCPPGSTCLAGDTLVTLADGSSKAIADVVTGERVLSYQPETGGFTAADVTQTFRHPDADGTVLVNGRLRATPNHPFFVDGVWKRADELAVGDVLTRLDGGTDGATRMMVAPVRVETLESVAGRLTTYNLEVAGTHDYFAGGYLVHNKSCRICDPQ